MKLTTLLLTMLILLSSCFKTDIDSNAIPFTLGNEDEDGSSFILDYHLTITGATEEYFGKDGSNLGSSPINSKALVSDYSFCIKALELKDTTGAYGASEKLLIYINGHDYEDSKIDLMNSGSKVDTYINYYAKDKLFVKKSSGGISGTAHLRIHFGSCED